jgi:hypothetical protein
MKEVSVMKRLISIIGIVLLGLLLITGCEKDTSSAMSDQQLEDNAIRDILTNEEVEEGDYLVDWGIDDGDQGNMYNGFSTFSIGSPFEKLLTPFDSVSRFGRILNRRIPRTVIIRRISPDTILVNMERVWGGNFLIVEPISNDSLLIHRKPLLHSVRRTSIFTKRLNDDEAMRDPRRRWKLSGISMGKGQSRPVTTLEIHQLDISTSSGDFYTFSNPLQTIFSIPENLPTILQGDSVTVQVLVSNNSSNPFIDPNTGATETLLLHYGISRLHRARRQFRYMGVDPSTGLNLYEGSWRVHEPAMRPFHAVIDAIDNGTIYDSDGETYPYNSATWGLPYRVVLNK